jgi:hypothetical protein
VAVWTFTLTAVYAASPGSMVRTVYRQSGSVTRLDGSPVTVNQGGVETQQVTTDENGGVQFTIDRTAWGPSAPQVLIGFDKVARRVLADEFGDYLLTLDPASTSAVDGGTPSSTETTIIDGGTP